MSITFIKDNYFYSLMTTFGEKLFLYHIWDTCYPFIQMLSLPSLIFCLQQLAEIPVLTKWPNEV